MEGALSAVTVTEIEVEVEALLLFSPGEVEVHYILVLPGVSYRYVARVEYCYYIHKSIYLVEVLRNGSMKYIGRR